MRNLFIFISLFFVTQVGYAEDNFKFTDWANVIDENIDDDFTMDGIEICNIIGSAVLDEFKKLGIQPGVSGCDWRGYPHWGIIGVVPNRVTIIVNGKSDKYKAEDFHLTTIKKTQEDGHIDYGVALSYKNKSIRSILYTCTDC